MALQGNVQEAGDPHLVDSATGLGLDAQARSTRVQAGQPVGFHDVGVLTEKMLIRQKARQSRRADRPDHQAGGS